MAMCFVSSEGDSRFYGFEVRIVLPTKSLKLKINHEERPPNLQKRFCRNQLRKANERYAFPEETCGKVGAHAHSTGGTGSDRTTIQSTKEGYGSRYFRKEWCCMDCHRGLIRRKNGKKQIDQLKFDRSLSIMIQ